jgi:hypothetical protein
VISPPFQNDSFTYNNSMKFPGFSLLVVLGLLLSLFVFESAFASCVEQREAVASKTRVIESERVDLERSEPDLKKSVKGEPVAVIKTTPDVIEEAVAKPTELDLEQLVARLKKTEAIGFLTKLAIRSDVLDFRKSVESYRKRKSFEENAEMLRGHFNGLLLKILALLEHDPVLSRDIHLARESIWKSFVEVKS